MRSFSTQQEDSDASDEICDLDVVDEKNIEVGRRIVLNSIENEEKYG